jgi:hypothetical protein
MFSLSSLTNMFDYVSGCVSTYLTLHYSDFYDRLQNNLIIIGYNTIKLYTDIKESAFGKKALYYSQVCYDSLTFYFYHRYREPEQPCWTYSCHLQKYIHNYNLIINPVYKYYLIETYNEFEGKVSLENKNENQIMSDFFNYKSTLWNEDKLSIFKYQNNYIIRYYCGIDGLNKLAEKTQLELSENKTPIKRSKLGFLSVEYLHYKMSKPVPLDVTKNMCMVGNHLFSPEFIFKCLKYQNESYIFDLHYVLRIMDNNLNEFVLASNQYIELTENSYIIYSRY